MKDGGDGRLMVTLTINGGKFLFFYVLTAFLNLNSPSKIMGQVEKVQYVHKNWELNSCSLF